jgi:eukaryotic-like serine/threonine-protein kinase
MSTHRLATISALGGQVLRSVRVSKGIIQPQMPLTSGSRLGSYAVLSPLGAGGMGEVYRARDSKLGRDVALKVLPEAFARDAERMARFQREAKVLASLNHSNIASIYGLEDSGATHALVMELVEGPTLADRIKQGPIPMDEALRIAKQICEALEYAHERGIVHRDLKPANVKVTNDDAVKVLDFGLAKAVQGEASEVDISTSPTMSRMATLAGVLLGTAAYMSPEQAKGKPVDRRADIWAFGCVLYEMLTTKMLFHGETVTDTLAAVVRAEPDWSALPAATPLRVRVLLQRCLQKDPKQRLRDIGDARISIDEVRSGAPLETSSFGSPVPFPAWRRLVPWAVAGVCFIAALGVLAWALSQHENSPARLIAAQILPPPGTSFALLGTVGFGPPLVSPDGSKIAFVAVATDGTRKLWVRSLGSVTVRALEGTDGASMQFWSPDSRDLGFFANGKLRRIPAAGGSPLDLSDVSSVVIRGATWGANDVILFTPTVGSGLFEVRANASGAPPQPATQLDKSRKESSHRWPQFLPDGKHFLFFIESAIPGNSGTYLGSLDGGQARQVLLGHRAALYVEPGYLLFMREAVLMAQRFSPKTLQVSGDAVPIVDHVEAGSAPFFAGNFSASGVGGYLVYDGGTPGTAPIHLSWFDRSGTQLGEIEPPADYESPRLSPDGKKLAVTVVDPISSNFDIWIQDLDKGSRTRLTFGEGTVSIAPSWSPDGSTITYQSNPDGRYGLFQKAADGTGQPTSLFADEANERVPRSSRDGRYVVFQRQTADGATTQIWAMPLFGDRKPFPAVQSHTDALAPDISPDGKWLAYVSAESGRNDVYIVPFGHIGGKRQVSTAGGDLPRWRADGKELFFLSRDGKMTAAEIGESANGIEIGKVQALFQTHTSPLASWSYDVTPDGKKFVVVSEDPHLGFAPVTLVANWTELLKQKE